VTDDLLLISLCRKTHKITNTYLWCLTDSIWRPYVRQPDSEGCRPDGLLFKIMYTLTMLYDDILSVLLQSLQCPLQNLK